MASLVLAEHSSVLLGLGHWAELKVSVQICLKRRAPDVSVACELMKTAGHNQFGPRRASSVHAWTNQTSGFTAANLKRVLADIRKIVIS